MSRDYKKPDRSSSRKGGSPLFTGVLIGLIGGLAVAIPALFGYNYILSRVKDAKDDMHIFIDEFVTKMAEFYKEKGNE